MTLSELLTTWKDGAKISYKNGRHERFIGAYRADRVEVVTYLFYRDGIKFKVHK